MQDYDGLMRELYDFLDEKVSPELRQALEVQAESQRTRKSKHKYDLAKFGLDADRIRRDCAFVYEDFLQPLEGAGESAK